MLAESEVFQEDFDPSSKNEGTIFEGEIYLPMTRYYGSKRRLIHWIQQSVEGLKFDTVLDVFGGTGTVSLMFKHLGKKIHYNDILLSSSMQAKALLCNEAIWNFESVVAEFCDQVVPQNGFISENFCDVFYSGSENSWLDGAAILLGAVEDSQRHAELFYCLQQSCIQKRPFNLFHRKNYYLRVNNNQKSKFGNWVTWERSFKELMTRAARDLEKARFTSDHDPVILPSSEALEVSPGYDLVYLDPPYIPLARNDISYLERYHFLEGLASPEAWPQSIDWTKDSRCFKANPHIKQWHTRSKFKECLFELINIHRRSIVVLSYVMDAYPAFDDLTECFSKNFAEVRIYHKQLSHALAKKAKTEVLIIGIP